MDDVPSYIAHDGLQYEWPPPMGWWQATDGRWYPPRHDAVPPRRSPLRKAVVLPLVLVLFGGLGAIAAALVDRDQEPDRLSPEEARQQAAPSVTVQMMSTTRPSTRPPTTKATTTLAPRVTMPNGDEPFDGYPLVVPVDSLDYRVASWLERSGAEEAVALAPGVYVTFNPTITDLGRYYNVGAYGDCIMIDTYFPATGGSCWDGVMPGSEEPN